jgi:hypothetical protein
VSLPRERDSAADEACALLDSARQSRERNRLAERALEPAAIRTQDTPIRRRDVA